MKTGFQVAHCRLQALNRADWEAYRMQDDSDYRQKFVEVEMEVQEAAHA